MNILKTSPSKLMEVAHLNTLILDWAVAEACGIAVVLAPSRKVLHLACYPSGKASQQVWSPSATWSQGGPLVDKHIVNFWEHPGAPNCCTAVAVDRHISEHTGLWAAEGHTKLVACMRAIVMAQAGKFINVPKVLT